MGGPLIASRRNWIDSGICVTLATVSPHGKRTRHGLFLRSASAFWQKKSKVRCSFPIFTAREITIQLLGKLRDDNLIWYSPLQSMLNFGS
jgi:hypothetical protein